MKKAGVIGLGMIGGGIAESLWNKGVKPYVYDISDAAVGKLKDKSIACSSCGDVATNADVVMVCVVTEAQARNVIDEIKGKMQGKTIVLVSTISVNAIKSIYAACKSLSVGLVDCGVTPGNLAAVNGMVAMVGGDEKIFEYVEEVLSAWSKKTVYCGAIGSGMAMKLARNVITFGSWRVVKEAQELLTAAGGQPKKLIDVIETADPEGLTLLSKLKQIDADGKLPKNVSEKNYPLMRKDLLAVLDLANDYGVDMPATQEVFYNAEATLGLTDEKSGVEMADAVYGNGMGERLSARRGIPYVDDTIDVIFGKLWGRPHLSVANRRLLVIGSAAAMGRRDILKTQALAALRNRELSADGLREAALQLSYYVGWCNGGLLSAAIEDAIAEYQKAKQ